jgi:hypothetical protein
VPPVYDPAEVAEAIVACAENPKREVLVGSSARMMAAFHWIAPGLDERMIARRVPKDHFTNIRTGPTKGNLFDRCCRHGSCLHDVAASRQPGL